MTAGMVFAALGLAVAFAIPGIDPRLLTLNLSSVSRGLDVPSSQLGFLASAATLVTAAAVLAVGNLGDIYGLKRLLIYGLLANVVCQLLAALSPNYPFLMVMRLADGFALTALAGLSMALLTVSVPPQIRPVAVGIFMATDAILYGVSPLAGGWIVAILGWRGLSLVSPVLALVALIVIARCVVGPPRHRARGLDIVGVGLTSPQAWAPLLGAALALVAFVRHERQVQNPALDLALFARPGFVVAVLAVLTNSF